MTYILSALPYKFHELEPFISEKALLVHYFDIHRRSIEELNSLLKDYPEFQKIGPADLIYNIEILPNLLRNKVKRCAGNHLNHAWFWNSLTPEGQGSPEEELLHAINFTFDNFSNFKQTFTEHALKVYGSGWCWLVMQNGMLKIIKTNNSDFPLSNSTYPLLGLDMWEHAYYLSHQNKKIDYINLFWSFIDWVEIEERYKEANF